MRRALADELSALHFLSSLPILSPPTLLTLVTLAQLNTHSLIQIPVAAAEAFYSRIGGFASGSGDGTYIIPCDAPIGSIAFVFQGISYEIPPTDLLRAISRDGSQCLLTIAGVDNKDARGREVAIVRCPLLVEHAGCD